MKKATQFRHLVEDPEIVMIPGVADALNAKLAEAAGFKAIILSGYAASAVLLGAPDVGLLTMTEMAECARRIAGAVDIPLFADGDNGHGNATNSSRTMKEFENASVAAIFFEDQVSPKRCGHMSGKQVIPADEMVAKLRAVVDVRVDRDLLVMARTDALSLDGIDNAIERMHRYLEAGADLSFVEAPVSVEQMQRITREISAPNMANMVPGGKSPNLTTQQLQEIGFSIVAYPTMLTYAITRAAQNALAHLQKTGTTAGFEDMLNFHEFNQFIGLDKIRKKEAELYGM